MNMREIMTLAEGTKVPSYLFHGTRGPIRGGVFNPYTHFGTELAALERAVIDTKKSYLYQVRLNARNPLRIRDGENWSHTPYKLCDILHYTIKAISAEERGLIMSAGAQSQSDAALLAKMTEILEAKGFDSFVYKNRYEDAGKLSWVNFRPEQVQIVNVLEMDVEEALAKIESVKQ